MGGKASGWEGVGFPDLLEGVMDMSKGEGRERLVKGMDGKVGGRV